jgi:hypothetical protein
MTPKSHISCIYSRLQGQAICYKVKLYVLDPIRVLHVYNLLVNSKMELLGSSHSNLRLLAVRSDDLTDQIVLTDPNGHLVPERPFLPVKKIFLSSFRPIFVLGLLLPKFS